MQVSNLQPSRYYPTLLIDQQFYNFANRPTILCTFRIVDPNLVNRV